MADRIRIPAAAAATLGRRGLPSPAAALAWLASAGEARARWRDGRLSEAAVGEEDEPACVPGAAFEGVDPPAWIAEAVAAVDAALPNPAVVLAAISGRALVLTVDPAACRAPAHADPTDAAACLLACRAILLCREAAVEPALSVPGSAIAGLEDASLAIAAFGGERVVRAARALAAVPSLWLPAGADDGFPTQIVEFAE